jgi:hypothetical protein
MFFPDIFMVVSPYWHSHKIGNTLTIFLGEALDLHFNLPEVSRDEK